MKSSCSCARTKRPWLLHAESIRWPMISLRDHLPGAGRRAASVSENASSSRLASSTVFRKSSRKSGSISRVQFVRLLEPALHLGVDVAQAGDRNRVRDAVALLQPAGIDEPLRRLGRAEREA